MESHHMANLAWVVAGNYNDPPESSVLVQVLQAAHLAVVVGSGQGTRWQQKTPREIGCAASQADICAPAVCETVHLSDHTTTCQPRRPPLQRGRFKPQPRWEKPSFVSAEDWKALVRKAWFLCCQNSDLQCLQNLGNQPIDVEQEWKRYMSLLSAVMRLATQNAAKHITTPAHERELLQKLRQPGVKTGKGVQKPEIQMVNMVLRNAAPANSSQADKALSRKLARMYTVLRLAKKEVSQGKHWVAHCNSELHNLLRKVWPYHFVIAEASLAQVLALVTSEIASCRADRNRQEAADTEARFQKWRQKFVNQDIKAISEWVSQSLIMANPLTPITKLRNLFMSTGRSSGPSKLSALTAWGSVRNRLPGLLQTIFQPSIWPARGMPPHTGKCWPLRRNVRERLGVIVGRLLKCMLCLKKLGDFFTALL